MAVLTRFPAGWRTFPTQQLAFIPRALHKSAASEALEIPVPGEEALSAQLVVPGVLDKPSSRSLKTEIKSLKEMPGPGMLSNLFEFFWRDGFSRIHEIQVII